MVWAVCCSRGVISRRRLRPRIAPCVMKLLLLVTVLVPFVGNTKFASAQATGSTTVTIPLDETCTAALITTDKNFDSNLDIDEYFTFTKELRPECLSNVAELPLELRLAFLQLSCDCSNRQNDNENSGGTSFITSNGDFNNSNTEEIIQEVQTCCVDQDPMIPTIGASIVDDATITDYLYIQQVCTRTLNAITGACGPRPQDTIAPGNVMPPTSSSSGGQGTSPIYDGNTPPGGDSGQDDEIMSSGGRGDDVLEGANDDFDILDDGAEKAQLTPVQMIMWIAIGMISLPFCCIIFCCCCCHRRRWCLFSGKRGSSDSDSDSDGSDSDSAVDSENASDSSDSLEVMSRASRGSRGSYNSRHSRNSASRTSQQQNQHRSGGANTGGMMGRGIENSNRVPVNPAFQQQQQFQLPQPPQPQRQIPAPPPVAAPAPPPPPPPPAEPMRESSISKSKSTPAVIAASFTAASPTTKTMKKFNTEDLAPSDFLRRQQYHQQQMGAFEPTNSSGELNYAPAQSSNKLVPEPEPDFENSSVGSLRERELMGKDPDYVPTKKNKKKNPSYVSGGAAVNRRVSEPEFDDTTPTNPRLKKTSPQPSPRTADERKKMYSSYNNNGGGDGTGSGMTSAGHKLGPQLDSLAPPPPLIQMPPPSLDALAPPLAPFQMPPPSLDALIPPPSMPPPPAPPIEALNQHYRGSPPRGVTVKAAPTPTHTTRASPHVAPSTAPAGIPNPYFSSANQTRPEQPLSFNHRGPDICDDDVSIGSASIGSVSTSGTSGTRGRTTDDGDAGLKQSRRKKSKDKKEKKRSSRSGNSSSRRGGGPDEQYAHHDYRAPAATSSNHASSRPSRPMPHFDA